MRKASLTQGGGTTPLIVNGTYDSTAYTVTLDKTWKEIREALEAHIPIYLSYVTDYGSGNTTDVYTMIGSASVAVTLDGSQYVVYTSSEGTFETTSETGYPLANF